MGNLFDSDSEEDKEEFEYLSRTEVSEYWNGKRMGKTTYFGHNE